MADIGILGVGRMGRGIAEAYAFAGKSVLMIDVKQPFLNHVCVPANKIFEFLFGNIDSARVRHRPRTGR